MTKLPLKLWLHLNILQSKSSTKGSYNVVFENRNSAWRLYIFCTVWQIVRWQYCLSFLWLSRFNLQTTGTVNPLIQEEWYILGKGIENCEEVQRGGKNPDIPNYSSTKVTVTGLAWRSLNFIMIFIFTHCLFSFLTLPAPTSASYNNKWVRHEAGLFSSPGLTDLDLRGCSKRHSSTTLCPGPPQHSGLMSWNKKETNCWCWWPSISLNQTPCRPTYR